MQLADIQPSRPYDPTLLGRVIPGTAAQLQAAVPPASVIQGQAYVPVPGASATTSTPSYLDLTDVPTSFTPAAHKTSHATGGADALTPGDIGAATSAALNSHTGNTSNPHSTTAAQVGAPTTAAFTAHTGNTSNPHATTAAQVGAPTTAAFTSHTSDTSNPHGTTATQVGLGNVTNDLQVKRSEMGAASGVATLDAAGKLNAGQSIFTGPGTVTTRVLPVYGDTTGNTLAAAQLLVTVDGAIQTTGAGQSGSIVGNARGTGAVDLSTSRNAASQVASGTNSVLSGGLRNAASGTLSVVAGGGGQVASATNSAIGGGDSNVASSLYGHVPGGFYGNAARYGGRAQASGRFAAAGDNQRTTHLFRIATADATPTQLTLDGAAPSTQGRFVLSAGQTITFVALLAVSTSAAGVSAGWEIKGVIKRPTTAATTVLVPTPSVTSVGAEGGAAAWTVAVSADTTNGGLVFTVTGAAATSIRWSLGLVAQELTF